MALRGSLKGANVVIGNMKKVAKEFPKETGRAMYREGQIEMTEAKKRTPVSPLPARKGVTPGTLRASGRVHEPEFQGRNITVTLSFGGPGSGAEDYAVIQHENPDYHHTTGQWKYLESVLNESQPHMGARLAARMNLNKITV